MKAEDDDFLNDFAPEQLTIVDKIIKKYKGKPGGLIPVLEETQVALGYLPASVQKKVAKELNLPVSRVYGVVTFYSFFTMKPRGKHTIRVCMGTACYVLGGKSIAETIKRELKVKQGETTDDLMYTFESVRCIGACGLAPAVVIDDVVQGKVKDSNVIQLLHKCTCA